MTLDRLYRDVENLKRQYKGLAGGPQLALSSIENGAIDSMDADGNLKMTIGQQDDGGNTINVLSGPTPPTPTGFTVDVDHGKFIVHWSGDFDGDKLAPSDWSRAEVHASQDPFFVPSRATARGSIVSAAGGEVTIGVLKGPWTIKMLAWSQAGKMSAPSAPVTVEVPGYGDIVLEEIDAATTLIKNAGEMLLEGQQTLADKLAGIADLDPEEISDEIAQARQEAIDAALAEIANVEGTLTSAIGGKSSTKWSTSNPPVNYDGAVGDTWVKLTSLGSGGREIRRSRWQGDVWVDHPVDGAVLSNVDASTITTGFLDVVNRIRASAIAADKLLIGTGGNLIPWDQITRGETTSPHYQYGSGSLALEPANSTMGLPPHLRVANSLTSGVQLSVSFRPAPALNFKATPGTKLNFSVKAYALSEGIVQAQARIYWYTNPEAGSGYLTSAGSSSVTLSSTGTTEISVSATAPAKAAYALPYISITAGSAVGVVEASLKNMVGGTLIEPGGIQTPHLAADVLEVGNLKVGTAALAEAVIKKLFAEVVVARMAQAEEFIGENAILTGAVTAPKITASEELWAKIAQFVEIRAEHIAADAIDGMVITAPTIQSARSGRRWVASADSIRVINENDDVRTRLSPEGSTFKGEVEAETLVVNGGAELKANNTLAQGAKLTLAAGVADPTAPPVVQPHWEGIEFDTSDTGTRGVGLRGLAWDGTYYWTTYAGNLKGVQFSAFRINPADGSVSRYYDVSIGNTTNVSEWFGVTCIGSELFWLYRSGYEGRILVTDLNLAKKRETSWNIGYSKTSPLGYKPGIGNDGTNLVIAQCTDAGRLDIHTCNKTTGALISTVYDSADLTRSNITGVYVGNADWGRDLVTVAKKSTGKLPSFNPTTGVYDSVAGQFDAASTGSVGVVFHDGKFHTLDPSGVIHEYADSNTGDGSGDWWATYYWYTDVDDDGVIESSDYQSRMAPPKRFTWPRRAGLKILGQPMPTGVEALGPALAKKTTQPVRTDFSGPGWQVDSGKPSARYVTLPTNWTTYASPSDTNTFPEAESSVLESASGTFRVQGDGSGHWGPLTMRRDGIMSGLIETGDVLVSVDTGGTPKEFTVNLPAGRFSKPPVVWVQVSTTAPQLVDVSVLREYITTSNFKLYFCRTATTATRVTWFAMDRA